MTMRKFFLRRFKNYFLLMMIPIFLLTAITLSSQYRDTKNGLLTEASNTLTRLDENFKNEVSSSAYQYELLTYNPRLVLSLKKYFQHGSISYSDVVLINSIRIMLGSVAESHDYIHSIYLYLDGFDDFFTTSGGFTGIHSHTDQDWYQTYLEMNPDQRQWIVRREFEEYSYLPPTQYITVFQRMGNISGVIVINIDVDDFEHTMDTSTSLNQEMLFVLNETQQILSSNQSGQTLQQNLQEYLTEHPDIYLSSLSRVSLDGKTYFLKTRHNEDYHITYAALIPVRQIWIYQRSSFVLLLGAAVCNGFIILFLSYLITKRNFQKINDIIQTFDDAEKGILPQAPDGRMLDEYDVILDNVIRVFLKSTYLQQELKEKQYQKEIAERAALQLQINPHFLFNTLQTLDFKALELSGQPSSVNAMISNLSDILKYSLEEPGKFVTLSDELTYLKKYIQIQKERYGNQLIVYFEIDEALMSLKIPRLILQPLVENSISHGISAQTDPGYIKVRAHQTTQGIRFSVTDSGVGISKEEIQKLYIHIRDENSKNIGLTNVNRRLLLYYGEGHELKILGKPGLGTCVSFVLPAEN